MTSKGAEKMKNDTIGVDISKDHFDAHRLTDGGSRRFVNDRSGHRSNGWPRPRWIGSSSSRPGPITALSNARWAWQAFLTPRSISVRRAASQRRAARWRRPSGRGNAGTHGSAVGVADPAPRVANLAPTQGASSHPPSPGERPHRRQEPQKCSDRASVEAPERPAPRTDRTPGPRSSGRSTPTPISPDGSRSSPPFQASRP
jgi:hypothetical protein